MSYCTIKIYLRELKTKNSNATEEGTGDVIVKTTGAEKEEAKSSLDSGIAPVLVQVLFLNGLWGDLCLPSSEPSVCQMEIRFLPTQQPQLGPCSDPPPVNKALFYSCWCLHAGGWQRKWAVESYLDCLVGDSGLSTLHMGKQDSSATFLDSGKLEKVGKAIQKYSRIPLPPTAAEETQPGSAVLSTCTLHTQLPNLCCFLPRSRAALTLCTKGTSISGSSSNCPP